MIQLYKVFLPKDLDQTLKPVFESGFISEGPKAAEFQTKFQEWIGNPYTALTNSCTSALTIALRLAGVGIGDEVITSPMTCLATNEPVLTAGAKVVWCDIDPETGNIDTDKIEGLITNRTKAILFVDWAGTPAELDEITRIAADYGLKTIEDAAHSIGAEYKGHKIGTVCDYTCFSFQAIKHFTTIDGGAIACKTKEDFERAVTLRWFGLKRGHNNDLVSWTGDVPEPGYKMHMNDVNASVGLEQLKYIDKNLSRHRNNGNQLQKHLADLPGVETTFVPDYTTSSYWIFTILLRDAEHRAKVSEGLVKCGVGNNISHTRNDSYSLFEDSASSMPGLDDFSSRMLNIPCGWWVDSHDLYHIYKSLEDII